MIKIDLPAPVYLNEQALRIATLAGINQGVLKKVLDGTGMYVVGMNDEGIIPGSIICRETCEQEGLLAVAKTGSRGIELLCKCRGIDIEPIYSVDIPGEVFIYAEPDIWKDICFLAYVLENRVWRISALAELSAPSELLAQEEAKLRRDVEALESTGVHRAVQEDETPLELCCLKDAGWSLLNGWSPEKAAEIEAKEKAASKGIYEEDEV